MDAEKIARRWFLAALPYFLVSVGIGVYMGASSDHALFTVHSHVGLLGWAAMGLTGLLYRTFPAAATSKLAAWHFFLYQAAVPVMLIAVTALILGNKSAEPVAGAASVLILISVVLFCWNIWSARRSG
ncbi:MAG: hypothetical protein ACM3PU_09085 [Gemmatimonadota bacterium]